MQVISQPDQLRSDGRPICGAIGVFDGLHLGHQKVIGSMIEDARRLQAQPMVITFDQHPQSVLAPEKAPLLIYPLAQKLRVIESLGVEAALVFHFDLEFSRQPAEIFAHNLVENFGRLASLSVGGNFFFGHHRKGNAALLQQFGKQYGFAVTAIEPLQNEGHTISSTRVRKAIHDGHLELASQLLGRKYGLASQVIHGDQRGRQLGFPTANLDVAGLVLPPFGVYAARTVVNGLAHPSVLNLGHRPTVKPGGSPTSLEVHLLDYSGDLYDRTVEVQFVQKLRGEEKFPSLDALKTQITRDIQSARSCLSGA
jgi:riboflavin kinase/FMN adenylyltransferase